MTILAILFGMYFLPTLIASARHHWSWGGIFAVNFFLGWTFFGWIAALIWAMTYPGPRYVVGCCPHRCC